MTDLLEAMKKNMRYIDNVTDVQLEETEYEDGSEALIAWYTWDDGEFESVVLSVNLSGYGMYPPKGCLYFRNYAESEGVALALQEAGYGEIIDTVPIGMASGHLFRLTGKDV